MQIPCPHCGATNELPPGARTVLCHSCHEAVHNTSEAPTVTRSPTEATAPDAPTLTSARVRFNCPECGRELTVPADEPVALCPDCGASLEDVGDSALRVVTGPTRARAREARVVRGTQWMREHFGDRFEVLEFVKSGGMGAVYRARQRKPARVVALKVLLGGHFATPTQLKRFEREAQAVALLQHPAVVPVYEYGDVDGQPYFTMEFIEGSDLRTYSLENNLSRQEICRLIVRVCDAIQYAHEHGVIHRDLKPGNILVDALKRPRILDFGLSRAPVTEEDGEQRLTLTGEYLGTPRYMSPEQAMGQPRGVDERTDVFALGVMLYEMLVGALPYPVENVRGMKMVEVLSSWDPLRPGALRPDFPRDLELILLKAVARDKNERYDSARALGEDLENYLAGRPITARPATLEYLLTRWIWRHRKVLAPVAVAALVLAAISVYYVLSLRQALKAQRAREAEISRLKPKVQQYTQSFKTGRDAVDQAIHDGDWQSAYTVAGLAPRLWPGEHGVDELARKVRRAAEQLARRRLDAYSAAVDGQDYDGARREAADMAGLAGEMPYQDLKAQLAAVEPGFDESCWQALKVSLDAAYTPEQVKTRADAYLAAFPGGPHAAEARAMETELSARPADYFQRRREAAFDRAMDARRWDDAQRVLDSSAPMPAGRLAAMRARLAAIIRPETAPEAKGQASIDAGAIVYDLAYSPDGNLLAAVTGARPIALLDPATRRSVQELPQEAMLRTVAFSPHGRRLATGAEDGTVEVWSLAAGRLERTLAGHSGRVRSLAFTPDGSRLLTADGGSVALWDLASGRQVKVPNVAGTAPAALSPDGKLVAATLPDGTVGVWELSSGLPVQTIRTPTEPVVMVFSPDGSLLATGHTEAAGRHARIWRVEDGALAADLTVRTGAEVVYEKLNWALAFSPDGSLLATGDVDNDVKLYQVAGGRQAAQVGFDSVPRSLAFSPDSRSIAAGLTGGTVEVLGVAPKVR